MSRYLLMRRQAKETLRPEKIRLSHEVIPRAMWEQVDLNKNKCETLCNKKNSSTDNDSS